MDKAALMDEGEVLLYGGEGEIKPQKRTRSDCTAVLLLVVDI